MRMPAGMPVWPEGRFRDIGQLTDIGRKSGWGGRIRTYDTRYQKPMPYHLATPQSRSGRNVAIQERAIKPDHAQHDDLIDGVMALSFLLKTLSPPPIAPCGRGGRQRRWQAAHPGTAQNRPNRFPTSGRPPPPGMPPAGPSVPQCPDRDAMPPPQDHCRVA